MASPNTRIELLEKKVALLMKEHAPNLYDPIEDKPKKPDKTKGKGKAKEEDDDKPKKKRTSGYILYSNANRDEVRERLAENAKKNPKTPTSSRNLPVFGRNSMTMKKPSGTKKPLPLRNRMTKPILN